MSRHGTDKARPESSTRPNVVLILADDMGFSDLGCFGSEIPTPRLDALARGGVRLTQMYNCARCCPTRASLLTGLYPHQAGVGHMVSDYGTPGYRGYLNDRCVTIAEVLKTTGYHTFMSGKWHVGGPYDVSRPDTWRAGDVGHPTPRQRGFDRFFGTLAGAGSYYRPPTLMRDDLFIEPDNTGFFYTDAINDQAVAMIESLPDDDPSPFFLYLAHTAPHWPLHAPPDDISRHESCYRAGWDGIRTARHERLRDSGLLDRAWPISLRDPQSHDWRTESHQDWQAMRMATYAAQIERMDQGIGRVIDALRRRYTLDNTLILFVSDNGGSAEFLAEDGHSARYDIRTLDGQSVSVGNSPNLMPGPATTFMSYDLPWSNASNAPFRLHKCWVHEGGIATPFIAHWPGRLKAGHVDHQPAHVMDLMPTVLDAAGATYPTEYAGSPITPTSGRSLLGSCRGERESQPRVILWEHQGNAALRAGQWKLVRRHPQQWELYDMAADRMETVDLAEQEPAMVRHLANQWQSCSAGIGVQPWESIHSWRCPPNKV